MPAELNPDTRLQLDAFRRRWRRLNGGRGFFASAAVLLGAMGVAATADGVLLLELPARKFFTVAGYLGAFVVWCALTGRFWLRPLTDREIARRLEGRWPGLEGKVLAAVELAETRSEARFDSEAFREVLQHEVADRVRGLNMRMVLPGSALNGCLLGFIAVAVVFGALAAFSPLQYETLLARAFMPWADIQRPSRVRIAVLSPGADTRWLPVGDEFEVRVRLTGPTPNRVVLESWYGEVQRTWNMVELEAGVFAANLTIGAADARFRVTGGDGSTGVVQLPTRSRPHVEHYEKEYQPPDYTAQPTREVREADGDLAALEGTRVRLRMKVDQPVKTAEMLVITELETNRVPLTVVAPDVIETRLGLTNAAVYQIRLVATETGFENKFAPKYEIKPWPDLAPKVSLTTPESGLVVAPDDRLAISGRASDDVGLRKVLQMVQVNGGEWSEYPLSLDNLTNAVVRRDFDLIQLKVANGDRVRTRLVATDQRGGTGESESVEVVVGAPAITSVDERELQQWRQLGVAMEAVTRSAGALQASLNEEGAAKFKSDSELERAQAAAGLKSLTAEVASTMEAAANSLTGVMRTASPGRESARLGLFGQGLSQARHGRLAALEREAGKLKEQTRADLPVLGAEARGLNADVRALEAAYQALMSRKLSGAAAEYFDQLARRQDEINDRANKDQGRDPKVWQRLARRQTEAAAQVARGENMLAPLKAAVTGNMERRLAAAQAELQDARSKVEAAARTEIPGAALGEASEKLQREVRNAEKSLRALVKEQFVAAEKAENALTRLVKSPAEEFRRLNAGLRRIEAAAKNGNPDADLERAGALRDTAARLRDSARLEERRPGGDPAMAAELGLAATGLEHLAGLANHEVAPDEGRKLESGEQALRRIEAAHQVADLEQAVKQLGREERWEGEATNQATDRTADWNWINDELGNAQREVKRSGLPEAVVQALDRAARDPARRDIGRQMLDRKNGKDPVPVAGELGQLAEIVGEAKFAAEPARDEARRQLEALAPKFSEHLQRLSEAAQTQANGARRALGGENLAPTAVGDLQKGQNRLDESVAKSLEAIRRDGNRQNVFTGEGREMARDADDALEMISRPAAAAERAMKQAVASVAPADRRASLQQSAVENGRLAEALKTVADHLRQRESGFAADTRRQLRAQETALGIREELDRRYQRAEDLQRVAQGDPEALREALREQVKTDPELRAEVGQMAGESMAKAENSLDQAAAAQREIARQMRSENPPSDAVAAQARSEARSAVERASEQLRDAGGNAAALNSEAGKRLAAASQEAGEMAREMGNTAPEPGPSGENAAQTAERSAEAISNLRDKVERERASTTKESASKSAASQAPTASGQSGKSGPANAESQNGQSGQAQSQAQAGSPPQRGPGSPAGQNAGSPPTNASAAGNPNGSAPSSPSGQASSSPSPSGGAASRADGQQRPGQWLARAMNALEAEEPDSKTISPAVGDALRAAFESQAESIRKERNEAANPPAGPPGERMTQGTGGSGSAQGTLPAGEGLGGGGVSMGPIGEADTIAIDWGRLPPRVARDLRDSLREGTPGEYREQVNAYFRMVAERASGSAGQP